MWDDWYQQVKEGKIMILDDDYKPEAEKGEAA